MSDSYQNIVNAFAKPAAGASPLPPAAGVVKQMPGLAQVATKAAQSPNYQALQQPASYGVAGLAPLAGAAIPASIAAAPFAAAAAPLAGIAYGVGKLVAPKWTDEAVGKIKDFIKAKVAPIIGQAEQIGSSYETGMVNAVPGSRFVQSKLPEATQEYINQIIQQHPLAAKAGQVAGTVGMMAIPGANIVKGAGIIPAAANAALNVAPFALGTGLDVGATTGDVGQGVKAGLLSEGLGAGIGAVAGGLSKIPAVNRFLAKIQMKGAGMSEADLRKVLVGKAKSMHLQGGAVDTYVLNHMDDLVTQSADMLSQYGTSKAGKAALKEAMSNGWNAHATLVDGLTGKAVTEGDTAAVLNDLMTSTDPDVRYIIKKIGPEGLQKVVGETGRMIDGEGWSSARNMLQNEVDAGGFGAQKRLGLTSDDPRVIQSKISDAWRDHLDANADHAMEWAKNGSLGPEAQAMAKDVPDLHVLKATWPANLAVQKTAARETGFMSKIAEEASPTFIRGAVEKMIQGGATAGGGLLGGIPGAVASNILGRAAGSIGGRLAEKGVGALAGALRGAEGISGMAAGALPAEAIREATAPASSTPTAASVMFPTPEQAASMQGTPAAPAQPIPNAPQGQPQASAASATPPLSPAEQAQASFSQPEPAKNVPGTFNDKSINARLEMKYARYVRQFGEAVSFDEYKQAAYKATDGFNPMEPATWKAMFDDKETSDRLYKGYMGLQKMQGANIEDVLNHYSWLINFGPRMASADRRRADEANARTVSALSEMTGRPVKEIDERLRSIAFDRSKSPAARKQAVAEMIIQEGGVDIPTLSSMGLLG